MPIFLYFDPMVLLLSQTVDFVRYPCLFLRKAANRSNMSAVAISVSFEYPKAPSFRSECENLLCTILREKGEGVSTDSKVWARRRSQTVDEPTRFTSPADLLLLFCCSQRIVDTGER